MILSLAQLHVGILALSMFRVLPKHLAETKG